MQQNQPRTIFNKVEKAIKLFLIVFTILGIQTFIDAIIAYNKSIDVIPWPIIFLIFGTINFLVSLIYSLIASLIGGTEISYRYTIVYATVLASVVIALNILWYKRIYLASDELFYLIYGLFLLLHFFICLVRRSLIIQK
jgi:hypothetical protein